MTRKDTSAKHGFLNVHFHKKFLERISVFPGQLIKALRNYKEIKNDHFKQIKK